MSRAATTTAEGLFQALHETHSQHQALLDSAAAGHQASTAALLKSVQGCASQVSIPSLCLQAIHRCMSLQIHGMRGNCRSFREPRDNGLTESLSKGAVDSFQRLCILLQCFCCLQGTDIVQQMLTSSDNCSSIASSAFGAQSRACTDFASQFFIGLSEEKVSPASCRKTYWQRKEGHACDDFYFRQAKDSGLWDFSGVWVLQADLMEKIGEVLTNYMALKEEQVNEAMGGFSSKMQTASQNLGASSKLLHDYATASQQRLKVRLAFLAPQQASTLWTLCLLHPRHLKRSLSNRL